MRSTAIFERDSFTYLIYVYQQVILLWLMYQVHYTFTWSDLHFHHTNTKNLVFGKYTEILQCWYPEKETRWFCVLIPTWLHGQPQVSCINPQKLNWDLNYCLSLKSLSGSCKWQTQRSRAVELWIWKYFKSQSKVQRIGSVIWTYLVDCLLK